MSAHTGSCEVVYTNTVLQYFCPSDTVCPWTSRPPSCSAADPALWCTCAGGQKMFLWASTPFLLSSAFFWWTSVVYLVSPQCENAFSTSWLTGCYWWGSTRSYGWENQRGYNIPTGLTELISPPGIFYRQLHRQASQQRHLSPPSILLLFVSASFNSKIMHVMACVYQVYVCVWESGCRGMLGMLAWLHIWDTSVMKWLHWMTQTPCVCCWSETASLAAFSLPARGTKWKDEFLLRWVCAPVRLNHIFFFSACIHLCPCSYLSSRSGEVRQHDPGVLPRGHGRVHRVRCHKARLLWGRHQMEGGLGFQTDTCQWETCSHCAFGQ